MEYSKQKLFVVAFLIIFQGKLKVICFQFVSIGRHLAEIPHTVSGEIKYYISYLNEYISDETHHE